MSDNAHHLLYLRYKEGIERAQAAAQELEILLSSMLADRLDTIEPDKLPEWWDVLYESVSNITGHVLFTEDELREQLQQVLDDEIENEIHPEIDPEG